MNSSEDQNEEQVKHECPETYSISSKEIMPFLLDMSYKEIKKGVKPSIVRAALKLSTEELLEKLRNPLRKYKIGTKRDTFRRSPEAVIFINFKKGVSYTITLTITNQSPAPENIKIWFEESRHFCLTTDDDIDHQTRIAPGMSYSVNIIFLPTDQFRDYIREVRIVGDKGSFTVPIYGVGPRPLANMPDKLVFPPTLLKVQSTVSILLKNTGLVPLIFVHIPKKPFSASIQKAIILPEGILEVAYHCYPLQTGYNIGTIKTLFKNEFCISTELECQVQSARVELETNRVVFEDVFMGLSSQSVLVLRNTSDYTLHFSWKMYDEEAEQNELNKMIDLMTELKDYQMPKYKKLDYMDMVDAENQADIYERILEDEKNELLSDKNGKFLFESNFFDIIPKVDKVLPKSEFQFTVIFSPLENIFYNCTAYLDIEGVKKRVRVALQGNGIGPPVMLTVKKLNAAKIYLTDRHQYELGVKNKGVIAATVTYQPKETDWGGFIDCIPHTLKIGPDTTKAFVVVFYSEVQGDFIETLDFVVEESNEQLQCIFSGTVICPLLKCVPAELDFGTVSVGMEHTRELSLVNDSRVAIHFEIETDEALKRYLEIVPTYGAVSPNSNITIKVTFCSEAKSRWRKNLLLIMWKSRQYTKTIPFRCVCSCPKITCTPHTIKIKFCFLNCPYKRTIKLHNPTDLPGYAEYRPEEVTEDEAIKCVPQKTKIYFKAHEVVEIGLKIVVTALGLHELPLYFLVIGGHPQRLCTISCNGQGPVITYHPDEVDFGKIGVLSRCSEILTLFNDSPISAQVRVYCKSKNSFDIEESIVEIAPEEKFDVVISAVLINAGKVRDTIYLEILHSDTFAIKVFGEGIGTSILCDPPLWPKLNLGVILTYKQFVLDVSVTNKSSFPHKILFTRRPSVKSLIKVYEEDEIPSIFNIEPRYLELESNQESKIAIKCYSKKPKSCEEDYYCHALIDKTTQPEKIMEFVISADFVDPKLQFSKTEFNFQLNFRGSQTDGNTQDILTFNNQTGVSLQVLVTVDDSFSFVESGAKIGRLAQDLKGDDHVVKEIQYCPIIKEKRRYKQRGKIIFEYENHPKTDVINLYGEVMFPTIRLFPGTVDFHCIPLGSTSYSTIVLQNISAMEVSFKWLWLEKSIVINDLDPTKEKNKFFKIAQDVENARNSFMEYIDIIACNEDQSQNEVVSAKSEVETVTGMSQSIKLSYDSAKYLEEMRKVLFPVLAPFRKKCKEDLDGLTVKKSEFNDITKLFSLEPSEGTLQPNEYTLITIGFSPPPNTDVKATAICKVQDGEEEPLTVMGKSSKLSYILNKKSVNYGNQVFCEICTDELTLTNDGLCCIDFKVTDEESVNLQADMLDITPREGSVEPGKSITFKIDYFPGIPGRFEKPFVLELGYLEPVTVQVHGYAVVNQVFLHVPRLDMELSINDNYKALAWVTPEYLESVHNDNTTAVMPDNPEDSDGFLKHNGWTYVSYNDLYPSLMDINLAMERIVAFNHVTKNKNILKDHSVSKKKIQHIPDFCPPSYCVDFGYVVRDIPVCYTVLIYNYGPIKADVKLLEDNKTALLEQEFKIEFKNTVMSPGDTTELFVLFSPTRRRCKTINAKIENSFRLTVSHGPIISVRLKAEVTVPSVRLERESLHFEKVYCGDVLRKTVILTNDGNVRSKWFATISKSTLKGDISNFFVIPTEGELDPGKKTYLDIHFVPTSCRKMKRTLQIEIESNSKIVLMDLFGEGLETNLTIVPTALKFSPTLCFFEDAAVFGVQNLADVPMEIYFPTLDAEEHFQSFWTMQDLIPKDELASQKYLDHLSSCNTYPGTPSILNKMACSEIEDPLAKYTPKELDGLLMEYITADGFENDFSTKATTHQLEDSTDLIEIVEPEPLLVPEPIERGGVLIIFHGASTTDYYKAANEAGIALSFPVYSVDRLIIESLVERTHPCAEDIMQKIDETISELPVAKSNVYLQSTIDKEDDSYDNILDKITAILTTKPAKGGKKSPAKEKGSKASSEKSQGKNKDKAAPASACFLNIMPEVFADLLRPKLKQFHHLIVESLHSTFLTKENECLYTILKSAGTLQYIHLVILSFTVNDYVKIEEAKIRSRRESDNSEYNKTQKTNPQEKSKQAPGIDKESKKGGSEKISKVSQTTRASKGGESAKKILQHLNKNLRTELEKFAELEREIVHISDCWDRRNMVLKRPYNEKSTVSGKKDTANKDSTRTLKSSVKKQASLTNVEEPQVTSDTGLHLWIVLNSTREREIDFCEMIKNCLIKDYELEHVLDSIRESMKETFQESETLFSVISKPSTRKNYSSPAFNIRNFKGRDSVESLVSRGKSDSSETKIKRRKSSKSSRRSGDSKVTNDSYESALPKTEKDEFEFLTKVVVNPQEIIKYQVIFSPVKCGKYNQTYTLETTKNNIPLQVTCQALCEYPRIDLTPEVMFPKTLDNYREKASYDHFVYIKDQNIFDFGSVIVAGHTDKCPAYCSDIVLRNPSSSNCKVFVSLSGNHFYAEPSDLVVASKCEGRVKVCIKPTKIGTVTTQLYLSVRNNPKVEEFTLACTPCKLEFSISPKSVGFEKVPVKYRARRIIKLSNSSPINLRWELVDPDWVTDIFNLSGVTGFIGLYSVSEIVIDFRPQEELSFPKRHLQIKVFDANSASPEPSYIETITIHADSVEYNLEVEDLIDFGEIKGGVDSKHNFAIINKGKCEVALKFYIIDNPLEQTHFIREFFTITPQLLNVGAQKTEHISVIFHPTCNLSVKNLLLFVINMVESMQSGNIVKSYKVKTSATVFMPSYSLCPHSQMNFGHVQLMSSKRMTIQLTNNGKFAFSFVMVNYAKFLDSLKKGVGKKGKKEKIDKGSNKSAEEKSGQKAKDEKGKSEKSSKSNDEKRDKKSAKNDKKGKTDTGTKTKSETSKGTKSSKMEKKKMKITKLDLDGFSIVPSSGIVDPGETFEICVEFTPRAIKEYNEDVLLNIAEIEDIKKKKIFILKAFGCEPKLNLKDFENVFIEQYNVTNLEEFMEPKNIENYCIFVSSEIALYFKLVCVNNAKTIQLHLKNIGFVTANMTAKLDDFNKNVFSVSPVFKRIDPYSACCLEVTFKPDSLEEVRGTLEISYNASADNKLIVQLIGQACLPQIKLLKPIPINNEAVLNFDPVCVGYVKKEIFLFKNVGPLRCQVIVEVYDEDEVFELVPDSNTIEKLNVQNDDYIADMKQHLMVNMDPNELAQFEIVFRPTKQQSFRVAVNLHIISNPFEVNKIIINADSYDDNIILEDLPAIKMDASDASNSSLIPKNMIGYLLDFGYRELNRLSKLSFRIRNRSDTFTYKFRFYCASIMFVPEVGHLKPLACKEILVIFKSSVPVSKEKEEVTCSLSKIQYASTNEDPLSWDNRQKFVYWTEAPYSCTSNDGHYSAMSMQEETSEIPVPSSSSAAIRDSLGVDVKYASSAITATSGRPSVEDLLEEKQKLIYEGTEPEIITLPDSLEIIPVFLTVSADYSRYTCDTNCINFLQTYVKEKSVQKFEVKNLGAVPLKITWDILDQSTHNDIKKSNSSTTLSENSFKQASSLKSASASSLCSSDRSLIQYSPSLPITIDPAKATIDPSKTENFNVIFSPELISTYTGMLKSSIDALDPSYQEMCIQVNGNALPVPFYFELDDGHSTNKDLVLKFESIGNGTECFRKLFLVNPNGESISFNIFPQDQKEFSYFICETSQGKISNRKKAPVTFCFAPQILGYFKQVYVLKIPEKNISNDILLEGVCREPKVYFSESNTVLKPTVPKVKTVKSLDLVNDEMFPVAFKFIKKSQFDDSQQEKVEIYPIVGTLKPKSKTDIRITFVTSNMVSIKFHVKCMVEKLKTPLTLNIAASCMEVRPTVSFTGKNGKVTYLNKDTVNVIDWGHIHKGKKEVLLFNISNEGQTGIFYKWNFDAKPTAHLFNISVDTEKGFLKKGLSATTCLQLQSLRIGTLKQFKVNLNIMYGPNYLIHLNAISDKPTYSFSFNEYNFGYCFVQNGETKYYSTMLSFKNLDNKPILVENLFDKTEYLTVDFKSSNVLPGESRHIQIFFHPQKIGSYQANVSFSLDTINHTVPITGEAIQVKLELVNPKDKLIYFDEVMMGTAKKYRVGVVNRTDARMEAHFSVFENLAMHQKKTAKLEKTDMKMPVLPLPPKSTKKSRDDKKRDKSTDSKPEKQKTDKKSDKNKKKKEQEKDVENQKANEELSKQQEEERKEYLKSFNVIPNMFIDIPPHGKGHFEIIFQPNRKMHFEEKIYFETQDYFEPLCAMKGFSVSPEFSLDSQEMLFLGVVVDCSKTQLITLQNTGDVIGSFTWIIDDKRNIFTIEPTKGFVMPNNDMKIKVTFTPKQEKCEYKVKARCVIKELKEPLKLFLKGNSVNVPEPKDTVMFSCNVREQSEKSVTLNNPSSETWLIYPEITGDGFSTPKEIIASPFADTQINITYSPKIMTLTKPHEGTMYIKLPTGEGIVYKLLGNANPPLVKRKIEREIHCKQNHYETIAIQNWSSDTQTFDVITEVISPLTSKTLYKILGFNSIQLQGMQTKKYRWGVYLVNDIIVDFRVTFKNPHTGEYEFYDISLKGLPSEPIETIIFSTRVREPITKQIKLENPVDVPITFAIDCAEKNLLFEKSLTLEPYTTIKVDLTYAPLQTEDISTTLTAKCEELGSYTYPIKMRASPPKPENSITFKAELGERALKTILFKNVFDRVVEFTHKFDNEEFYMERCSLISTGDTSKILIGFEPSGLGHMKSQLFMKCLVAGEYIYPLEGEGIPPTPKGPYTLRLNYPTSIEFKNPFNEETRFTYQLQPDIFYTELSEEVIKPRKRIRILVYAHSLRDVDLSCPITGKLTIQSDNESKIEWTYYLILSQP